MFSFEESRKMMIKMVHESLLTCEKINRIVEKEQKYGKNDFYVVMKIMKQWRIYLHIVKMRI